MNPHEIIDELQRLSTELDRANKNLLEASVRWARGERAYRLGLSKAFAAVRDSDMKLTAPEKEALADSFNADAKYERDLAESLKTASLEAVRSLRVQISATQTISAIVKGEMALAGIGQ